MVVGKLCDCGCSIIFTKEKAFVTYKGKDIGEAPRDKVTKLWTIRLSKNNRKRPAKKPKHPNMWSIISPFQQKQKNIIERLILFLHESLGHPTRSTLLTTVKRILSNMARSQSQ